MLDLYDLMLKVKEQLAKSGCTCKYRSIEQVKDQMSLFMTFECTSCGRQATVSAFDVEPMGGE